MAHKANMLSGKLYDAGEGDILTERKRGRESTMKLSFYISKISRLECGAKLI